MNNTFSLQQNSQTGNLDSKLALRQYKLDVTARFMDIKSLNPRLRKYQLAKELRCSSSTSQRYRNDVNMLSPYKFPPNSHKRRQMISNRENDLKKSQMTSNDLKILPLNSKDTLPNI